MSFRASSIKTKLLYTFVLVFGLASGNSIYSWITVGEIRSEVEQRISSASTMLDLAHQITTGVANMRSAMRGISLFSAQHRPEQLAKARAAFEVTAEEIHQVIEAMGASAVDPSDRAALSEIRSALEQWGRNFREFYDLNVSGHAEEATALTLQKTTPLMDLVQKDAAELARVSRLRQQQATGRTLSVIERSRVLDGILLIALLGVSVLAAAIIFSLTKSLRNIIQELFEGSQQITAASGQVASSSHSLAQGATEQAASLEQTSASSEEISSMARKNAENSHAAAQLMTSSGEKFGEANQKLEQMVVSMREINASSDKIARIIKVINEIAFQTNILALNAAVEAARAGEAGMGFAVVADEVRNLSQRCAQAAQDTAALIEESIARSSDGRKKVDEAASAIMTIIEQAAQVRVLVDEVSVGSAEQMRGIEQVAKAVVQMQTVTQTTAANAEESASASEQLAAQSETLRDVAARLQSMADGGGVEERQRDRPKGDKFVLGS